MSSQTLNIILAIGFSVIVVCAVAVAWYLIQALKSITLLTDSFREKVKMNILRLIPAILVGLIARLFKKRG